MLEHGYNHGKFAVGDLVLIHKKAYNQEPHTKFNHLWFGPFKILQRIGTQNYKLELGKSRSQKHDTFNIKALRRYHPRNTLMVNVPSATLEEIATQLHHIERIIEVFYDNICEVRWSNAEVWDTTILPLNIILNSSWAHLLEPFKEGSTLRCFRLE